MAFAGWFTINMHFSLLNNIKQNLVICFLCLFAVPAFAVDGLPIIGVASFGRGLIVLVYVATITRCLYKAQQSKKFNGNYAFWLLLAAYLGFFALDKILGFQDAFTNAVRDNAEANGWYESRASLQMLFALIVGFVLGAVFLLLRVHLINAWRRYKITWAGVMLLTLYMVVRTMSTHSMDAFIANSILGISVNALVQVGLLGIIFFGTFGEQKPIGNRRGSERRNNVVEIARVGDPVHCPGCGMQPLANTKDGRTFKCRKCGFSFTVNVVSHTILSV